jgi:ABC-type uncharacterized transport system permease subunit
MFESILAWGAVAAFGAASVILWFALKRNDTALFRGGSVALGAGTALAFGYMLVATNRLGAFPIINPWIGASFLSFLLSGFSLIAWIKYRERAFLAGVAPVASLFALLAAVRQVGVEDLNYLAGRLDAIRPDTPGIGLEIIKSAWFPAHVTLAMSAYALFALAATMGLLHLALLKVLKNKRGGRPLQFLPSLPVVEQAGGFTVSLGVGSLFVALVLGGLGARDFLHVPFLGDPKELAGSIIFVLYTAIELSRRVFVWPGRRTALAHVLAFGVLLVVFMTSSLMATFMRGAH